MRKLMMVVVAFSLFLVSCSPSITGIPWKVWTDTNIPCEGGKLYDYRGSTCEAPDLDAM